MTCIYLTGLISVLLVDLKCNLSEAAKCGRTLCTWSCDGPEELSNTNKLYNKTKRPKAESDGRWGWKGDFRGSKKTRVELIGGVSQCTGIQKPQSQWETMTSCGVLIHWGFDPWILHVRGLVKWPHSFVTVVAAQLVLLVAKAAASDSSKVLYVIRVTLKSSLSKVHVWSSTFLSIKDGFDY